MKTKFHLLFLIINFFTFYKCYSQNISTGLHSLFVCNDSTVRAWGPNDYGQLGYSTFDTTSCYCKNYPVEVIGLTSVVNVAASSMHSLALKADGTVWAWGANYKGQLGLGDIISRSIPVQLSSFSGITKIACSSESSLALKNDSTVWAWGRNDYYQLGDGTNIDRYSPVKVVDLTGVIDIASGELYSLALKSDGSVWAWGRNNLGNLGNGTYTDSSFPVQVIGLSGVKNLVAGASSMVLKNDSTVWAWGHNSWGTIGNNSIVNSDIPIQTFFLSSITQIAAKGGHCFAVKSDGTLWAWGLNNYYQLGDTAFNSSEYQPKQIAGFNDVKYLATGGWNSIAVKNDGTVWSWGKNEEGVLGLGFYFDPYIYPFVKIPTELFDPCSPLNSISEIQNADKIKLYPNPATNIVTIEGENISSVMIFDINGKVIVESTQKQIDISALSKGVYSVVVISKNNRSVKKLVKM